MVTVVIAAPPSTGGSRSPGTAQTGGCGDRGSATIELALPVAQRQAWTLRPGQMAAIRFAAPGVNRGEVTHVVYPQIAAN